MRVVVIVIVVIVIVESVQLGKTFISEKIIGPKKFEVCKKF